MNLWITVAITILSLQIVSPKFVDKSFPKKVTSTAKPTKGPKTIIDEFTELPPDDIEFIKELDKQFKLHGEKIRIKIERDNSTTTTKNSKRTIDGELGYGYHHPNSAHGHRFFFSRPRYMLYPYSQRDIPPFAGLNSRIFPGYSAPIRHHPYAFFQSAIQIQPSHAFEIKETTNGYQTYPMDENDQQHVYVPQYHQQQAVLPFEPPQHRHVQQQQYVEPVIVLRIPGPPKYASHLQALLQQYLEIRAAQYIKELQENEAQQQQQQHQQDQQHPQQQQQEYQQHQQQHQEQHQEKHEQQHEQENQKQQYQEQQHQEQNQQQVQQQQQEQPNESYEKYEEQAVTRESPHAGHHPRVFQPIEQVYESLQYQSEEQRQPAAHQNYQPPVVYDTSAESRDSQQQRHGHHQLQIEQAHVYDPHEPTQITNYRQHIADGTYHAQAQNPIYVPESQPNLRAHLQQLRPHSVYGPAKDSEYATATVSTVASHISHPINVGPSIDQTIHGHNNADPSEEHHHLPISENYPRSTHTKVVFTGKETDDHSSSYPLTPVPSTAASYLHSHRNHLHQYNTLSSVVPSAVTVGPLLDHSTKESIVSITQRPRGPFNYHAHHPSVTLRSPNKVPKRDAPYSEEQFKKFNKLINRLKRKNGSQLQITVKDE